MEWTEIVITVKTDAVEAVANFIHEADAGGVVIEHQDSQTSTVTAYFPAGEKAESILASLETLWSNLEEADINAEPQVHTNIVRDTDWAEEWKKYYKPVRVGNICITPSWLEPDCQAGQTVVHLDPGMAFGTGTHPTTQMCLAELSAIAPVNKTVLDLGTGSGILAIVAAKLGAARVQAVDSDETAVKVAEENARRNNCTVEVGLGDAVQVFAASADDLAVANIDFATCAQLAKIFVAEKKRCRLILSGFPQQRIPELKEIIGDCRMRIRTQEGWGCLVLEDA